MFQCESIGSKSILWTMHILCVSLLVHIISQLGVDGVGQGSRDVSMSKLFVRMDSSGGRLVTDHTEDLAVDAVVLRVEARVSNLSVFIDKEKPCAHMVGAGNHPDIAMLVQVRRCNNFT